MIKKHVNPKEIVNLHWPVGLILNFVKDKIEVIPMVFISHAL